ncbi:hypothetical protein [Arthrobacter sp. GMC3]|uniref:hypothetical protein n=1 Tax=Arthrobacter sp. GMC3 TaxID=2058894 RepID=UPI000CE41469|nr:hypothetical protein [Arthrobacter sp. GMC3]
MATIQTITATLLIQVGADEPKPIGTIEIPIEISTGKKPGIAYRGSDHTDESPLIPRGARIPGLAQ